MLKYFGIRNSAFDVQYSKLNNLLPTGILSRKQIIAFGFLIFACGAICNFGCEWLILPLIKNYGKGIRRKKWKYSSL